VVLRLRNTRGDGFSQISSSMCDANDRQRLSRGETHQTVRSKNLLKEFSSLFKHRYARDRKESVKFAGLLSLRLRNGTGKRWTRVKRGDQSVRVGVQSWFERWALAIRLFLALLICGVGRLLVAYTSAERFLAAEQDSGIGLIGFYIVIVALEFICPIFLMLLLINVYALKSRRLRFASGLGLVVIYIASFIFIDNSLLFDPLRMWLSRHRSAYEQEITLRERAGTCKSDCFLVFTIPQPGLSIDTPVEREIIYNPSGQLSLCLPNDGNGPCMDILQRRHLGFGDCSTRVRKLSGFYYAATTAC
jgi:hypothetical protein